MTTSKTIATFTAVIGTTTILGTAACGGSAHTANTATPPKPPPAASSPAHPASSASPAHPRSSASPAHPGTSAQVLPPATVPPHVQECTQQLSYGADGTAGPLTCSNGHLNVLAWDYYTKNNPLVMSLGPDATPAQVTEAICADVRNSTNPIETDAYTLAETYYGWNFGIDPSEVLVSGGCP